MNSNLRLLSAIPLLVVAVSSLQAESISVGGEAEEVQISVVRRVLLDYYMIRPGQPLEFVATGPTWLRVYSRLWWPAGAAGEQRYGLSLWQEDVERPLEFTAGNSRSSYSSHGHQVGKWRSFYVQVPDGETRYRLESRVDEVVVRFKFQSPRKWDPVRFSGLTAMRLASGRDTIQTYQLAVATKQEIEVRGPCQLRVWAGINYTPELVGAQNFVLTVAEGARELVTRNYRVFRSTGAEYADETTLVPSTRRSVKFRLSEGTHRLTVEVGGTLARTASIAVERQASEKYE